MIRVKKLEEADIYQAASSALDNAAFYLRQADNPTIAFMCDSARARLDTQAAKVYARALRPWWRFW